MIPGAVTKFGVGKERLMSCADEYEQCGQSFANLEHSSADVLEGGSCFRQARAGLRLQLPGHARYRTERRQGWAWASDAKFKPAVADAQMCLPVL
jgi:hypothetical protein